MRRNAEHAIEIDCEKQSVIEVEKVLVEETISQVDERREDGKRINRVGQPVGLQRAHPSARQTDEKLGVLIGAVQRSLGVGQREEEAPDRQREPQYGHAIQADAFQHQERPTLAGQR
jgi:hypothetical protein